MVLFEGKKLTYKWYNMALYLLDKETQRQNGILNQNTGEEEAIWATVFVVIKT